jgi:hypothetical protein
MDNPSRARTLWLRHNPREARLGLALGKDNTYINTNIDMMAIKNR